MRARKLFLTLLAVLILGGSVSAHDRKIGLLIDTACGRRLAKSPEEAAAHQVSCSLKEECAKTGFGVIVDGKFHKFDKAGNKLATVILKATSKTAGLKVRVDGHFDSYIISPTILETVD
jgi:hypothetical protein